YLVEVDDLRHLGPARHQQQPWVMRVLDDKHAAQREIADVDGVLLEPGMQRPVGGHLFSSSWPGLSRLRDQSPFGAAKARPSTSYLFSRKQHLSFSAFCRASMSFLFPQQ